jgi:NADH dehydrogenase FAD-containing subunit
MLPHLVLAGCGHAHLMVLEALAHQRFPPARVTLVSADAEYFYSGMISGVVGGQYLPADARLRPPRLAARAGAAWVRGAVARVDPGSRTVRLDDGRTIRYDLLSINIWAHLALSGIRGSEHGTPIRPFGGVFDLRARAAGAGPSGDPARILVVGAGAGGWEIAMSLDAALAREIGRQRYRIRILSGDRSMLAEHPEKVRNRASELLVARGIEFLAHRWVTEADPETVRTDRGVSLAHDLLIWAPGPAAPPLFRDSRLETDGRGYLLVWPTLQTTSQPWIFGAGDCAVIAGDEWVPRAGVYAVRQGRVLARNLARRLRGEPLETYTPQREWLSLMNTGDGRALASYRGFGAHNRALWWLKNRIDRRFVRRFQRLEE